MPEDPEKTPRDALETVVDPPRLDAETATLFVGDDARTLTPRPHEAGVSTTIVVPDDDVEPRLARRWMRDRKARLALLACLSVLAASALLFLVRSLGSSGEGAGAGPTARGLPVAEEPDPLAPRAPTTEDPPGEPVGLPASPRAGGPSARSDAAPPPEEEPRDQPARSRPLRATARCTYQRGEGGQGSLVIACDVTNSRPTAVRATIVPVIYRGAVPERVHYDEVTLAPGERVTRRYELRGRPERDVGSGCACEVNAAP